jgi:hypothetical protein
VNVVTTPSTKLPPDGTIIRVSPWRRQIFWLGAVGMGVLTVGVVIHAMQISRPAAALESLGFVLFGLALARMAICGVIVEGSGIKARSTFRTYRWRWEEIERFELRKRGETPRFRVHMRDGKVRGFLGFFARSSEEEARAQELFEALEDRLQAERSRR